MSFVRLNYNGCDIKSLLGKPLNESTLKRLIGAPFDSVVSLSYQQQTSESPEGLYFDIRHRMYDLLIVGITRTPAGPVLFLNDVYMSKAAPKGLGTIMLARMVRTCLQLGFVEIKLLAAGGRLWSGYSGKRWNGYYSWARMGFDMELNPADMKNYFGVDPHATLISHFCKFPENLQKCSTVQDIMTLQGGLDWWKTCGSGWYMTFDCRNKNTASIKHFEKYAIGKNL